MPIVDGKTLIGWGVVREEPFHFIGLFETQIEAAAKAINMGPATKLDMANQRTRTASSGTTTARRPDEQSEM